MLGFESGAPDSNDKIETEPDSHRTPETSLYGHLYTASTSPSDPVCAYVSKMFAVRRGDLPEERESVREKAKGSGRERDTKMGTNGAGSGTTVSESDGTGTTATAATQTGASVTEGGETPNEIEIEKPAKTEAADDADDDVLLGFARIYSGSLSIGEQVLVLLPKFNSALEKMLDGSALTSGIASLSLDGDGDGGRSLSSKSPNLSGISVHPSNASYTLGLSPAPVTIQSLYLMMGRELIPTDRVGAGQIFAVRFRYGAGMAGKEDTAETEPQATTKENGTSGAGAAAVVPTTGEDGNTSTWRSGTIVRPGLTGSEKGVKEQKKEQWMVNLGRVNQIVSLLPFVFLPSNFPAFLFNPISNANAN